MLPAIHSESEVVPKYISVSLVNLFFDDQVKLAKHVPFDSLQL